MKKKLLTIFIILIGIFLVALSIRSLFGGDEDTWIKVNGQWVKHGNPSNPMPEDSAIELLN